MSHFKTVKYEHFPGTVEKQNSKNNKNIGDRSGDQISEICWSGEKRGMTELFQNDSVVLNFWVDLQAVWVGLIRTKCPLDMNTWFTRHILKREKIKKYVIRTIDLKKNILSSLNLEPKI